MSHRQKFGFLSTGYTQGSRHARLRYTFFRHAVL